VLGVGGLGCSVAMSLARMGVGRIILIDRDIVDATNLNRQILFDTHHIGRRKVDAAYESLTSHHCVGKHTIVEGYHMVRDLPIGPSSPWPLQH
jgi:molybdopterin/thiamine biosynthesis adenylyltransferase